jgi:hypothetical protein
MDSIMAFLAFLAALGVATERITEAIKGLPGLSSWFAAEKTGMTEEFRKATVQILAIVVGAVLVSQVSDEAISAGLKIQPGLAAYVVLGALASGGSGMWNSLLDITREVKKQKEELTKKMIKGTA